MRLLLVVLVALSLQAQAQEKILCTNFDGDVVSAYGICPPGFWEM